MVLFARPAAQLLLDQYPALTMTTSEIRGFYAERLGVALQTPEWAIGSRWMDGPLSMDWSYAPMLWRNGFACAGNVPSLAADLEFDVRRIMRTDYVGVQHSGAGLAHPEIALGSSQWEALARRPVSTATMQHA